MREVLLITPLEGDQLHALQESLAGVSVTVIRNLAQLTAEVARAPEAVIIAYGTGIIVPTEILAVHKAPAYNFHAAPPAYPGRDPHHFAVYDGATEYGATAHVMTARVDDGPILGVKRFPVTAGTPPHRLLALASAALTELFAELAPAMASGVALPVLAGESWGNRRGTRRLFRKLCTLSPLVSEEEFHRRRSAFQVEGYNNLTTTLHGHRFRIEGEAEQENWSTYSEFTEDGYRRLVRLALAKGYRFASYAEPPTDGTVLWRHDVDFSVHRAIRLAEIEAEEGVRSTFFLNPHCAYYNLLEPAVSERVHRIITLGHRIGLHFDGDAHTSVTNSRDGLVAALHRGRRLLEDQFSVLVEAVSWHNPDVGNLLSYDDDQLAGMVNCYGATLRKTTAYVSDSNGYWRFTPASQVISAGHPRLHVLTHPGWWTPEAMPPRMRVDRALLGRARAVAYDYDRVLSVNGRMNFGGGDV